MTRILIEGRTLPEISRIFGLGYQLLYMRWKRNNAITLEEIVRPPKRPEGRRPSVTVGGMTVKGLAKRKGISYRKAYYLYVIKKMDYRQPVPENPFKPVRIDGLKFSEIADIYDIDEGTIRGRYYQGGRRTLEDLVSNRKRGR